MSQPIKSPQILTPVSDHPHDPPHFHNSSDGDERAQPVSLLTALIQSSDRKHPHSSGVLSAHSSAPSTAFSSPHRHSHGILAKSPDAVPHHSASILRRESNSGLSDDGHVGLGLGGMESLTHRLEKVEEKRESIGWADDVKDQPRSSLKFAVASHPNHTESFKTHNDSDTDDGYQEDEEDGFDSDSSQDSQIAPRFAFARPTNFEQHPRYIGSTHIPPQQSTPAPALLPPPARRGRGHIRVDETSTAQDKTCSRHRSPPPVRSRSTSHHRSAPHSPSGRLSDAGPRQGRAGSPMPEPPSDDSEDEVEDPDEEGSPQQQTDHLATGWRSDDAVFYGLKARKVTPISRARPRRHSSALDHAVFVDSDDEDKADHHHKPTIIGDFLRRASEHIPGFRRPSSGMDRVSSGGGSESGVCRSVRPQTPCPPALDNTPAIAQNRFANDIGDASGGLTHRLETALSIPSVPNSAVPSRAGSVNRHHEPAQVRPAIAQSIPTARGKDADEQLGWTDEALLEIRKSRNADRV
ncbi:hypothetical protein I302_105067 [Kwoniella bestiolae CBS 10118]|uniref:Uncharacterized protein n=1 Tax=Kwoniella bestiolae CBS 10118 TaxID=1296100 RepID=A0A1B9FQX7_9TREE|nr:hypothetical protein I302_08860 [Kwoniella bestiolae CBS 10118]OCF21189.1 hypothetical protein I302_08860 [Kwoniella bestiolae CBS 10118]